jgi:hypothetical protein
VETKFATSGFEVQYDVQIDPEFPGNGAWASPTFSFGRDGAKVAQFESRWGDPLVIAVDDPETGKWVGFFPSGGLGGITGVFALPSSSQICVINDGLVFSVSAERPRSGAQVLFDQVTQFSRVEDAPLVLLCNFSEVIAIGSGGISWRSSRLVLDDLKIESANSRVIKCSGFLLSGPIEFELDPQTGIVTSGRTLLDS